MAMIEEGEYLIVMEKGQDQRVLARTEHYEIAASAWMAAKFKFPSENLQLRKKAQLMQRHDGAPKPEEALDPRLPDWDVNLIRGSKNRFLGSVMAKNLEDAKEKAIVFFKLSPEQVERLIITPRR
jgi:hypothetical protein